MKAFVRILFFFLILVITLLLSSVAVQAAPAAPGTHTYSSACKSHTETLLTLADVAETAAKRNSRRMRSSSLTPAVNDLPLVVIVIGFDDQAYRSDVDWSNRIFRDDKSLAEYYADMSFGQFTFTPVQESSAYGIGGNTNEKDKENDGVIHVTIPAVHDDWTLEYSYLSNKDRETNLSLQEALIAAVNASDAFIDYAAYDVNGDGDITTDELAIAFVAAGYEASTSAHYAHGTNLYLWSHAFSFQEAKTSYHFSHALPDPDSVTVNSYIAIAEQQDDGAPGSIGTLAHELGHYLGLPDLYDTLYSTNREWSKYSVGHLSLMDSGLYGVDPDTGENIPYSLDAWSRTILGWTAAETAGVAGNYSLISQNYVDDSNYSLLRINTQNSGEYYLLENRSFKKWDAGLADEFDRENGGVILWHIDDAMWDAYSGENTINNAHHRPAVMPLYAESNGGVYAFIGKNSTIDLTAAFYDKAVWKDRFSTLGPALDLPIYGEGDQANLRSGRLLSGIKVSFLSDSGDPMQVQWDSEAHIHKPVFTMVTAPTCTEPGSAYYLCSFCGSFFADADGKTEISEPFTVEAFGHDYKLTDHKDATCTEDGFDVYICSRDPAHSYTETIPASGHQYSAVMTEPTCTEAGYTTYACTRCRYAFSSDETHALGHSFGAWTQTKAPTLTAEGEETRICSRCEANETRSTAMLPMPILTIRNYCTSSKPYDYRSSITFKADVEHPIPDGQIQWFVNGKLVQTGDSFTVEDVKESFELQAKYTDGGIVLSRTETEKVNVNTSFFAKLKAFFRALFGRLPKAVQEYIGLEIIRPDNTHGTRSSKIDTE